MARRHELEVAFAAERPGMAGGKARLPDPPRKLSARRCRDRPRPGRIRSRCEMACHDCRCTAACCPAAQARAVFEAIEQARVEAIGAAA